ncbi:hypothetical protein [Hoeflea ulvae]|uniref:Flagellar assembly protein FliH/Type III secretion system HrpE domain-containing protein n=1 Tax=Hoeflea ulvae TaxID=2983764 RepID=A0ABT3YCL2_9HYPH|nr:hypothetical protein [Hoeflea ulvae]MCY0093524.1 hypothetical protein [Hoeflea ulvae]
MTASLARLLPDFEVSGINSLHAARRNRPETAPEPERGPEIDLEALRAEARAEGEAAARAELTQSLDLAMQAEKSRHAEELSALRTELEMLAARTIPDAIAARSAGIAEQVAGDVEAVLAPLIDETIRARILEGLAAEIRTILALENAARISVSGPEGVTTALRDLIGAEADRLTVRETDGVDVEIEVDRTRFASRISDWTQALAENLS